MLKGKHAVITGANRGIGYAILEAFAINGADIWACVRTYMEDFDEKCRELEKQYGVSIHVVPMDLAVEEQVKEAFVRIKSETSAIDVLINNAGTVFNANMQMTSIQKMKELFQINFFSPMLFTQYILKLMKKDGSIINIASSGALDCNSGRTAYNSSKAAVIAATRTMSRELAGRNIRVNAIAPGLIDTDMANDNTPQDVMQKTLDAVSLKRKGETFEIANAVVFLASELSSYVTGQVWRIDGGM